ncbi:MAG: glycosyltransferase family 2 protein [Chloroflexi bacterium]|nr:glycosyltransferase family 2 protein [Chloroflexota bacterium]
MPISSPFCSPEAPAIATPLRSVVIPAYNEEHRIGRTLDRVAAYLGALPQNFEVIVVDDGSGDGTKAMVEAWVARMPPNVRLLLLSHHPNRGKGAAVREGCLAAQGSAVLFTDADLATPIEEAQKLWAALDAGYDLAIGTRVQPDGRDMRASQPPYRRWLGKLYHLLVGLVGVRGVQDTQCGFKAFTRETARRLFEAQQLSGIVFDTELLYLAQRAGLRIAQVPVVWTNVGGSRMRVTLRQALVVLRDLLSIRLRHLRTPAGPSMAAKEPPSR